MPARRSPHRHGWITATLLATLVAMLAGCGSSERRFPNVKPITNQPVAVTTPATMETSTVTTGTSAAESDTSGPASFVLHSTTEQGDTVKIEGWFGRALPASESDVEPSALSGCPPPANDGRAIVVKLDLAVTLESSLAGKVGFQTGDVAGGSTTQQLMAFVMDYSSGATCLRGEPSATTAELGTMQPGETRHFTIWLVLPDAITPSDPHPSEQTLGREHWLMLVPQPVVDGSYTPHDEAPRVSGPRVVHCQSGGESGGPGINYLAVVGHTPTTMRGESSTMGEAGCAAS
jgi:hypothetical protein